MALEMKFGGDRKQIAFLGGLVLVLLFILYTNYFSGPDYPVTTPPRPAQEATKAAVTQPLRASTARKQQIDRRAQEFRPRVGPARPEDRVDPMTIDPSLRMDLLARLEKVQISGGMRSLFDFSNVPVQAANVPKIIPAPKTAPRTPRPFVGPMPEPPPPPKPVISKPVAPPIPLRFYGFSSAPRGASKRGFFLDGDEVVVAGEGELIKKRYKVVRIGLSNVVMEDTQFQQQQTLPIVPDNGGGD